MLAPLCLLDQGLLERLDQASGVGAKLLMAETNCVAPREGAQSFGQILLARHLGIVNQHRDHPDAAAERRLQFNADEILGIVETARAGLVGRVEPSPADHRKHDVAGRHLLIEHLDEIEPGLDRVDIHEQLAGGKVIFKTVEQTSGKARIVTAPIVDEDLTGQAPTREVPTRRDITAFAVTPP